MSKPTLEELLAARPKLKKPKLPKPEKGGKPKRIKTKNPPGGPKGINQ